MTMFDFFFCQAQLFCIVVFLSFFHFVFCFVCCCSPCGHERLKSDSRVAFDHRNRHHHHQTSNIFHLGRKTQLCENLLKTIFDFFFCQAQLDVYYHAKKIKKNERRKIKLEFKLPETARWRKTSPFFIL